MLGRNFVSSNCVFAITKCDGLRDEKCEELKNSLRRACEGSKLMIGKDQIVCVGDYHDPEKNAVWVEKLMDTVGDNVDYNADKKDYTYFKPMMDEMLRCANQLQDGMDSHAYQSAKPCELYLPLKKALYEAELRLESKLDAECISTQKIVASEFAKVFDGIDKKHKRKKKFFFFNKSFSELEEDRDVIEAACVKCLKDKSSGKTLFISNVGKNLTTGEERKRLCENHDNMLQMCVTSEDAVVSKQEQMMYINDSARFYLDARVKNMLPLPANVHANEKAIAGLIATEFEGFFLGALAGNAQLEKAQLRSSSIAPVLREAGAKRGGAMNAATVIAMADLLDGKPDILQSAVSLFVKDPEKVGAIVSAGCGAAAVAIAVVAVAKKGIAAYNENIRAQNAVGEAWKYALLNAVEEQKNSCLDSFHQAGEKLLEHIEDVHRKRKGIDDEHRRIAAAEYAISDIRALVNQISDKYASALEAR